MATQKSNKDIQRDGNYKALTNFRIPLTSTTGAPIGNIGKSGKGSATPLFSERPVHGQQV